MLSPPPASSVQAMRPSINANNANYASFYDPISPGSSRRSSEMSNTGGQCIIPPPPSSHLLATHLKRFQQTSFANPLYNTNNRLSVPSISTIGSELSSAHDIGAIHLNPCVPDRRMSEPASFGANEKSPSQRPRSLTPTKLTSEATTAVAAGIHSFIYLLFRSLFNLTITQKKIKKCINRKLKNEIDVSRISNTKIPILFHSNQCRTASKSRS